jgi:multidrug efflux system membrane fusion protein
VFVLRAAIVLALCAATVACSRSNDSPQAGRGGPVPVAVASAQQKPVPIQLRAIGTVQPTETVTVRSRIGGTLVKIHFKEGQDVREGDLLFTLDARPLEAELRQAEANLAKSSAELENARKEAARYEELFRKGFVAQSQYEQIRTRALTQEATVRADHAAVQNARVQAGYAKIRAPMTGRSGAVQVHEGDLITQNQTPMVVINELAPIEIGFALPERELPAVQRYRAAQGRLGVDAVTPKGGEPIAQGELTFVDNRVDPATGTIQLKATFANDPVTLWPGQFVNVIVTLATEPAVVVPLAAVQTGQQGRYVFVVKPDRSVESRPVEAGRQVGEEIVVAQGVKPGETVVTEGHLRLFPGAKVQVQSDSAAASPPSTPPAPK